MRSMFVGSTLLLILAACGDDAAGGQGGAGGAGATSTTSSSSGTAGVTGGGDAGAGGDVGNGSDAGAGGDAGGGGDSGSGGDSGGGGDSGSGGGSGLECPEVEGLIPGVGLNLQLGDIAVFFAPATGDPYYATPIDTSARPWGCSGNDPWNGGVQNDLYAQRYGVPVDFCCAQGWTAELFGYNQQALLHAFEEGVLGDPTIYDGVPTMEEQVDLSATLPRNHPFTCQYGVEWQFDESQLGAQPGNPSTFCSEGDPLYFIIPGLCNRDWYYRNSCWTEGDAYYAPGYPHIFGETPS